MATKEPMVIDLNAGKGDVAKVNSAAKSIFACALYGFTSVSMQFFNKAVMNGFGFSYSNVMILLQMFLSVILLDILKAFGLVSYPKFQMSYARKVLPVAVAYCLNVALALAALRDLNVPMYSTLKRLTTAVVMTGEWMFLHKVPSAHIRLAVLLICGGAVLAGITDLEFDMMAYTLALGSCCVQALYLIAASKASVETEVNSFGLVYYNSILSIPVLAIFVFITGEFQDSLKFESWFSVSFQILLLMALFQGSLLNYALFFCTTTNSALTTTIVGQAKVILATALGFFIYGAKEITVWNVLGIIINTIGGYYYAWVKFKEKQASKTLPPLTAVESESSTSTKSSYV
mmetsp:Transcript_35127/g.56828  ORF Transcript_35127/g.56828 Transcript_35127/m.56828 type:complete len:346 (-) Transcript_35127:539-1576(-)